MTALPRARTRALPARRRVERHGIGGLAPRTRAACSIGLLLFTQAELSRAQPEPAPAVPGPANEAAPAVPAEVPAPAPPQVPSDDVAADAAPNVREAQTHHERALALYDAGDVAGARHELELAYELAPNFRALFNLGSLSSELHDYAAAADYFERYLAEGGALVDAERRREVTSELGELLPQVAHLDVRVNVGGAEISVDDRLAGVSPLRTAIRVNPGTHRVQASASGWRPHGSVLDLPSGSTLTVELQLLRAAPEPPPAAPSVPALEPPRGELRQELGPFPWWAWAGSAALAGAAVFSTVQALDADDAYENKRSQLGVTRPELDDAHASVRHWSLAADAFTAAAIVMSGVSLYLTLRPAAPAGAARTARWGIGVSANRLELGAEF